MPLLLFCEFLTQWSTSFTATDFEGREEKRRRRISSQRSQLSKTSILLLQLSSYYCCYPACKMARLLMQQVLKLLHSKKGEKKNLNYFFEQTSKRNPGLLFPFYTYFELILGTLASMETETWFLYPFRKQWPKILLDALFSLMQH